MTANPLRLGFIGGGVNSAVGTTHFIASQMDGLFCVSAGCFSRNAEINAQTALRWGVGKDRVHATWQELLQREKDALDAIVVLTPTPDHHPPVVAALKLGYAVICEKSLSISSQEAADVVQTVKDTNGFLAVTYNYTGYPMIRELRQAIQSGRLGRVQQVAIEMPQEGYARLGRQGGPMVPQAWRLQDGIVPTLSLDLGVHMHQLVDFLTGQKPQEVIALEGHFGQFKQVIDNTMAMVRYANDMQASFWFSKAALGHRNGLRVRVYGEEASAEWFQMDPEVLLFCDKSGHQFRIDRASVDVQVAHLDRYNRFKSGHPAGFLEAFANLYADIATDIDRHKSAGALRPDGSLCAKLAWEGLTLLEAMHRSSQEKRWVSIDVSR